MSETAKKGTAKSDKSAGGQLLQRLVHDPLAQRQLAGDDLALDTQQVGDAAAQGQSQRSAHQPQADDADASVGEGIVRILAHSGIIAGVVGRAQVRPTTRAFQ